MTRAEKLRGLDGGRPRAGGRYVPLVVEPRAYIAARVECDPNTGCWLWARSCDGDGYGRAGLAGLPRAAHRASWVAHSGSIPAGLHVLHRCDTPVCVNPSHLRLGTHADNMADCAAKGRIRHGPQVVRERSRETIKSGASQ